MELQGKTILITRAASQSHELHSALEQAGARVIECPAIEIVPVEDWTAVDAAASELNTYDLLILTSTNAVDYFMPRVEAAGISCRVPIAVVGTSTAKRLSGWNLTPALIPQTFRAEGLLESLPQDLSGRRILLPRAETARELLPEELRRRGATVDVVTIYRTLKSPAGLMDLRATLAAENVSALVLTSPSAVRFIAEELGDELIPSIGTIPVAVLGPVAAEAAASVGLVVAIQPQHATVQDLVQAIRNYFS